LQAVVAADLIAPVLLAEMVELVAELLVQQ
jgi:hypothetical protein